MRGFNFTAHVRSALALAREEAFGRPAVHVVKGKASQRRC
jgi:hypothetical protein